MIDIKPVERKFLPASFKLEAWSDLEPYATELENRPIGDLEAFKKFIADQDEVYRIAYDEEWLRYVEFTANTADQRMKDRQQFYADHITPPLAAYRDRIKKKIVNSPFASRIEETGFSLMLKRMQSDIDIFCEKNLPLDAKDSELKSKSNEIRGAMTITIDGEEQPLSVVSKLLSDNDRTVREEIWHKIEGRRLQDSEEMDNLFGEMVKIRHEMALNAGFENYRDYMFKFFKRYDYTPEDCYTFHSSVEKHVVPLWKEICRKKAENMKLPALRPWDKEADSKCRPPLKPFETIAEGLDKAKRIMADLDKDFHDTLLWMEQNKSLDLEARKNKRSGGFLLSFMEKKLPYMHANLTGKHDDARVIVHETGHAIHDYLMRDLPLTMYKDYPMELAELAAMSMELLTLDQRDKFFPKKEDLNRSKRILFNHIIFVLTWIAQIDAFQHEAYLNPEMTPEQRHDAWYKIHKRFAGDTFDWSGLNEFEKRQWQVQGHIYGLPFYYIEYGIAELGALQVYRNYKQNPAEAIRQFKQALSLGYTKSIPETYETAGIKFDFSEKMLKELMAFIQEELSSLD